MTILANKTFNATRVWRPPEIFKIIGQIQNLEKRNRLRGYCAKNYIGAADAQTIRAENSPHDSVLVGALLKGPSGLLEGPIKGRKKTSSDLFRTTTFPALSWQNEVCYTSGYVNSMERHAVEILHATRPLARLEQMDTDSALDLLLRLSIEYGASNFLSYKLAYLRSARELTPALVAKVSKIEDEFRHRETPSFHFSALENLSSKVSLFVVAQRRVAGLVGIVNGDLRKSISLSNFVPTPLDQEDVAGFLLRATESSLVDTVHAIVIIYNLRHSFGRVWDEFQLRLNPEFLGELSVLARYASEAEDGTIVTELYHAQNEDSSRSLDLYRASSAFLDRPKFAAYRSKFDHVIGARLLAEINEGKVRPLSPPFHDKQLLLADDETQVENALPVNLDVFYRTFLFLRFLEHKANVLTLSPGETTFLFENTMGLEDLLTEGEMRALYLTAPPKARSLMAVLALALFRKQSVDPDVDFEFRTDFIAHVNDQHGGSILAFIEYLLTDSPAVAHYIVDSLDEVTLEKMYSLVKNVSEAAHIRYEILKAVGQKLNRIEYVVQADAITTRSKVAKLQKYFDSSRMYVDSISMKKWLDANPTVWTEEYRSLYSRTGANPSARDAKGDATPPNNQYEYLVSQIAKDAFEQFCLNAEFGIQSYLGRRIRHNTLDGVTTDTVDAVLRKPEYAVFASTPRLRPTAAAWMASYKAIVDRLRREHLQFKSGSLFKATLDLADATTQDNIRKLSSVLMSTGAIELLNDLVIAFCWRQITPQLENAARYIRTTLLREAYASIDAHFSGHHGAVCGQLKAELREAVNEVFKKVADWFQIPQTGFISASPKELCEIILIDLGVQGRAEYVGDSIDRKYTGISVHRLYDCLAVLLQNAQRYGEPNASMTIDISACRSNAASLNLVSINVTSSVAASAYQSSKGRIFAAVDAAEAGVDMVTEGFSGIKKLKFITRTCEGTHTVRCVADDASRRLTIGMRMHAEVASEAVN